MDAKVKATRFRCQIRTTVTWKIISELMRRHHENANLRMAEEHPFHGYYDVLHIFALKYAHHGIHLAKSQGDVCAHLCGFNQDSQHLHLFGSLQKQNETVLDAEKALRDLRWPDQNDYVHAYMQADDLGAVVDQIDGLLGLPAPSKLLPPTTPPVLSFRFAAALLETTMLDQIPLDVRLGWSSYSMSEGEREELRKFPPYRRGITQHGGSHEVRMKDYAADHWLIYNSEAMEYRNVKGMLKASEAKFYTIHDPEKPIDLMKKFDQVGRSPKQLALELRTLLGFQT